MELPTLFILLNSTVPKKRKYQLNNWVMIIIHHWEKIPQVDILAKVIRELLLCSNKGSITLLYSVKIVASASILSHQYNILLHHLLAHTQNWIMFMIKTQEFNLNRHMYSKQEHILDHNFWWLEIHGKHLLIRTNLMILHIGRNFKHMIMERFTRWIMREDFSSWWISQIMLNNLYKNQADYNKKLFKIYWYFKFII